MLVFCFGTGLSLIATGFATTPLQLATGLGATGLFEVVYAVLIAIGVAAASGVRFPRWYWVGALLGLTFAAGFVHWLAFQSIFEIQVLCPWCMVTWLVTIPTFYAVAVHLVRSGVVSDAPRVRAAGAALAPWVPLMAFVTYAVVLLLAQLRLDAIPQLIDVIF